MRLLGCFSKPSIVLDSSEPDSRASTPCNPPAVSAAATSRREPPAFVPASIAELHPEYSHSEPYCFAARTESARLLVDRVRGAKGQTPSDRARALREQGLVVVRGPTYGVGHQRTPGNEEEEEHDDGEIGEKSVVQLKVESPTTEDVNYVESDDGAADENVDTANLDRGRRSTVSGRSSGKLRKGKKGRASKQKERGGKVRSAKLLTPKPLSVNASSLPSSLPSGGLRRRSDAPPSTRTYSSSDQEIDERDEQRGRRTPPALLAPIMVPRMSDVFDHNGNSVRKLNSPSVSNDSWGINDCSERFDDVEDDLSSGIVKLAAVGKHKVVHKAALGRSQEHDDELPSLAGGEADTFGSGASLAGAGGVRNKRKSKPFLPSSAGYDNLAPPVAPDSVYDRMPHDIGALPPAVLSRQISAGVMSDDIQIVDTSGDDMYQIPSPRTEDSPRVQHEGDLFQIPSPSPAAKAAAAQRVQHDDLMLLPRASAAVPPGIMRRASTTNKRKTVSFHEESPIIIEPNLRAPSKSLPRESMLTKSSSETSEYKDALEGPRDSFSRLRGVRDSVSLAAHNKAPNKMFASIPPKTSVTSAPPPKTMDIPRPRMQRELSDSSGAEEPFRARSSRRMSRVSARDKDAIRDANKRQSRAVAQAMSEQIRGVPKSAMLAFTENEVLISDDGLDDDDSDLSFRRSARAKSIRVPPSVAPGQVPSPPPPPPFQPETHRVRSVRKPPPPPASPIRY